MVSPVDEDYERYIEQLALEENERMESEESWADDILSIDEEPPTLEELNEMNPPEEDLSNLSFEEQAEWIAEELQPGGKIDRFIEELKLGENLRHRKNLNLQAMTAMYPIQPRNISNRLQRNSRILIS